MTNGVWTGAVRVSTVALRRAGSEEFTCEIWHRVLPFVPVQAEEMSATWNTPPGLVGDRMDPHAGDETVLNLWVISNEPLRRILQLRS